MTARAGDESERPVTVTVGLPVHNGEQFLAAAVDSLLSQSVDGLELILADNASTDGTLAICERYAAQDRRVRVLPSDANRGAAWNFNRCLAAARGRYFKWAAHDDLY